jgi:acetyl esterase/lipase
MKRFVPLSVVAVLLAWTSLVYVKLRTTRNGMLWLMPKLAAGTFSVEIASIGLAGAVLGKLARSRPTSVAYAVLALAAGFPVLRTWLTPEVFSDGFAGAAPSGKRLLRRRQGVCLSEPPEACVERDVSFWTLPESGRALLCDIWRPAEGTPASGLGLVYLHGSAWTLLDKDVGTSPFFSYLAAQGHAVMDVAYRLYPETDIPGMVADAKRAVAWLKEHAADYGVDPARIVLGGGSAGGHIALLSAYTVGCDELTPCDLRGIDTSVRGVLGWYSPVDLAACYEHYEVAGLARMAPERPDWSAPSPMMRRIFGEDADRLGFQKVPAGRLDWIVGGSPQDAPERYAMLSPISHVSPGCPPTLLMQGRDDIIVPPGPAFELRDKLRAAGVRAAVLLLPFADHGFDLVGMAWSPVARQALWHVERFLAFVAADPPMPRPDRQDAELAAA